MPTPIFHKSPEAEAFDKARQEMAKAFIRLSATQARDTLKQEIEATNKLMQLALDVQEMGE